MKSNDNHTLNENALFLKGQLAAHLSKSGHSLLDLEDALSKQDHQKTAELLKDAFDFTKLLGGAKDIALGLGQIGVGGTMALGGLGGLGLYGAYKGLKDSNKKLEDADVVKQKLDLARRELETEAQQSGRH